MSHTSTIASVVINDISAVRSAIAELRQRGVNCELLEACTPRAYFNEQAGLGHADYVIKLNDSRYDVGLYAKDDGSFEARADFWGRDIEKELGVDKPSNDQERMGKFFQMYGVEAATRKAVQQGYTVNRVTKEDGTISLQMSV